MSAVCRYSPPGGTSPADLHDEGSDTIVLGLGYLNLGDCEDSTDAGLADLEELTNVTTLSLTSTAVTDALGKRAASVQVAGLTP